MSFSPYLTILGRTLSTSSGADTRSVSTPGRAAASKFRAAARMIALPELTPTTCPVWSTVATVGSLVDQTNVTFGIFCESPGATICQAVAFAVESAPRSKILSALRLTCTDESCSVG